VEQIHKKQFRIILTQGLNRQIRRMCEYLGYRVVQLKRIRIMNIQLDTKVGRFRDLTKKEMMELRKLLADSNKHFRNENPT
jgi:23S rRNA pseudouridine2604 synthase